MLRFSQLRLHYIYVTFQSVHIICDLCYVSVSYMWFTLFTFMLRFSQSTLFTFMLRFSQEHVLHYLHLCYVSVTTLFTFMLRC